MLNMCIKIFSIKIGHTPGAMTAGVFNVFCNELTNPVNGKCIGGWLYTDGEDVFADSTVITTCKGDSRTYL